MSDETARLLIVDDVENNRFTLRRRLKRLGYENVEEAVDGRAALASLAKDSFDLVLLDVMMPGLSGYEVLEEIKGDMDLRDIPVIMVSALDEVESVIKCIDLGAEDYLPKPFDPTLLRARVAASLEKKRLRDQEAAYLAQVETERRRADKLLHAVLPPGAVRELKATNEVKPRLYDDVVVLFADIVGFTAYCNVHPAEQVARELQAVVGAFEDIVERAGLEKIKTIGDAFLATAGLLQETEDPFATSVRCGLQMIEAARAIEPHWELRVGVHKGAVAAGIIGHKQYQFDVWGDTVNTCSRLAAHAEPGSLVVAGDAWHELRGDFKGRSRGRVELKGKGEIELVACSARD
jgi:class 3 adenylate cyclase